MQLRSEDGWDYLGDGLYYRLTAWHSVHIASYNGITVLDQIEMDGPMLSVLQQKLKEKRDAQSNQDPAAEGRTPDAGG